MTPNDDQVHAKIRDILARPEFAPSPPDWDMGIIDALRRFFGLLGTLYDNSPPLFWLILLSCLTLLALLIWHIVWTVRKAFFDLLLAQEELRLLPNEAGCGGAQGGICQLVLHARRNDGAAMVGGLLELHAASSAAAVSVAPGASHRIHLCVIAS